MKPISAIDAIAPAFRRTISVLAQPFRLGFFLKLVVVAAFSGANLIAMGILLPMQGANFLFQFLIATRGASHRYPFPLSHLPGGGFGAAFFLAVGIGIFAYLFLCVVFFYLFTRFRFVVFDVVLFGERKISRAWSKYGRQTWRYYGLSILIALVCMLVATAVASPIILVSLRMMRSAGSSDSNAFGAIGYFMLLMMAEYSLLFVAVVVDGLVRDFLMPAMAVEDSSIEASFARFASLVREDPAGVFVFTLLRSALRMALWIALFIIMIIPVLTFGLILFGAGAILYHPLWGAGMAGHALFAGYAVIAGMVLFFLYMLAIFTVGGVVSVFTQCYALIFFAARYSELGNILYPPPAPVEELGMQSKPEPEPSPNVMPPPFLPESPPAIW